VFLWERRRSPLLYVRLFQRRERQGGLEGEAGSRDQGLDGLPPRSVDSARMDELELGAARAETLEPELREPAPRPARQVLSSLVLS